MAEKGGQLFPIVGFDWYRLNPYNTCILIFFESHKPSSFLSLFEFGRKFGRKITLLYHNNPEED